MSGSLSANDRLTLRLHPLVSFGVVPLFALANAGVVLDSESLRAAASSPVAIGIVLGLVVGKLLGVLGGTWMALRLPAATFVGGVRWGQVTGVAAVSGIGFTIALFVTDLAFDDAALQQEAKIGILAGRGWRRWSRSECSGFCPRVAGSACPKVARRRCLPWRTSPIRTEARSTGRAQASHCPPQRSCALTRRRTSPSMWTWTAVRGSGDHCRVRPS